MLIPGRMYKRVTYSNKEYTVGLSYKAVGEDQMVCNYGKTVDAWYEYFELQPEQVISMDFSKLEARTLAYLKEEQMNYQFSVSSDKLIDTFEIYKELTRDNPMAIVHRSDGMHTVIIHDSISYNKLNVIDNTIADNFRKAMEPYELSPDDFIPTAGGCLTTIINAVRAVRNAKVISGKPCEVKVVFPEI